MGFWETLLIAFIPAAIAFAAAYFGSRIENRRYKADSMAENAARHFLQHKSHCERSFKALRTALGGWDADEDQLRRTLVRAGAVRYFRKGDNKQEWWYLLSRTAERIEKRNAAKKRKLENLN